MSSYIRKFSNYLRENIPFYSRSRLRKVQDAYRDSQRRTPAVTRSYDHFVDRIVQPPYDYRLLCIYALYNPVLRLIHDAIIREVLKARMDGDAYDIVPTFAKKCPVCGYETQNDGDTTCPVTSCPGVLRDPDLDEKRRAEVFFQQPNESSETPDIIKSILRYSLAVDDWYLYIPTTRPTVMYVEDSRYMRLVADKLGRLGNGEYFCRQCMTEAQAEDDPDHVYNASQRIKPVGEPCPTHPGAEMVETCYVYVEGNDIKARFGKDEIVHKAQDVWHPSLYGHSKVVSVLRQIRSITAMDKFNLDLYSSGHLAKVIAFKDMDQDEVNTIAEDAEAKGQQIVSDPATGAVDRKLWSLWLATRAGADIYDMMPPSEDMQSLEWWDKWREVAGAVYGVQPVFMGATEQGKTGYHQRMQILVQNDTTLLYQQMIEEAFNEVVLPRLDVHDYAFRFNAIEEKNELADIQILQTKVETVIRAAQAEMDAELTEEGEVKISGKPKKLFDPMMDMGGGQMKPPKPEPAESPLETTTKGTRYTVIEHDDA